MEDFEKGGAGLGAKKVNIIAFVVVVGGGVP